MRRVASRIAAAKIRPREDPSNKSLRFARNRVRLRVLPELERINPKVRAALARFADAAALIEAQLATGATKLGFAAKRMLPVPALHSTPNDKPLALEIALVTDDVQAAFDKAVAAGAESVSKPAQKPWDQIVAYVRDNNGYLVELCTPVG